MKRDVNLDTDLKLFGEWMADAVSKSDNLRVPTDTKRAATDLRTFVNAQRNSKNGVRCG
ncbi:MAG: hypothetical protein AAFO74_12935 [Pseudomonadota bacterium]